jgi:Mannosyltransferase (PIG-V)
VERAWVARPRLRGRLDLFTREQSGWADLASSLPVRAVVGSRLIVWAAGLIALAIFGHNASTVLVLDPNGASAPFHSAAANFLLAPVARWDSVWYLQIAHNGYFSQQSSAMFPLYPLLIRIGSLLFGSELLVGLAISLVSVTVGLCLLERLLSLDFDERTVRTTVLLTAFFPVAFFFSTVYTESLYLLVSVGALYAARHDRWAWAGALGGLAAANRSPGILIAAPLVIMYLYGPRAGRQLEGLTAWRRPRHRVSASAAWLALVPAGLLAYLAYLGIAHGQPLASFHAEQLYWGHKFAGPFGGVVAAIVRAPRDVSHVLAGTGALVGPGDPINWSGHDLIDLGFVAFAVVGLVGAWRRVPFAYLVYAVLLLAMATSFPIPKEPLASVSRYILVTFPVFIGWARLLGGRPRLTLAVLATSAALLAVLSGLWATWAWIA